VVITPPSSEDSSVPPPSLPTPSAFNALLSLPPSRIGMTSISEVMLRSTRLPSRIFLKPGQASLSELSGGNYELRIVRADGTGYQTWILLATTIDCFLCA
jgi:hypothetical protein